ncbi:hypothetical protein SISNIDRAFT_463589 [Sistotremastrum niveocremeum HHB9708]|uniref:Uncharacterized protein n=1 Tax=Sistotremastrum niveocremeum HHB9708 TaxID=1314777 RepID=A0A164YEP1_9AGAM|nr:hypothetical protein SISNIDRAFT_463589 [Sistotremastrum niveocremeum HHB9708]
MSQVPRLFGLRPETWGAWACKDGGRGFCDKGFKDAREEEKTLKVSQTSVGGEDMVAQMLNDELYYSSFLTGTTSERKCQTSRCRTSTMRDDKLDGDYLECAEDD